MFTPENGLAGRLSPQEEPPGDPLFSDWTHLLLALEDYYTGRPRQLEERLKRIRPGSGPGCLVDVLTALGDLPGGKDKRLGFIPAEKRLYNQVLEDRRFIKSLAFQLEDTLEAGNEAFIDFSVMAVKEIREFSAAAAAQLALWCLETCCLRDFDYLVCLEAFKEVLSPGTAFALSARALGFAAPGEAGKCWLLSLRRRLRQGEPSLPEAAEMLALASACLEEFSLSRPGLRETRRLEGELAQLLLLLRRELEDALRRDLGPLPASPGLPALSEGLRDWGLSLGADLPGPEILRALILRDQEVRAAPGDEPPFRPPAPGPGAPPLVRRGGQLELFPPPGREEVFSAPPGETAEPRRRPPRKPAKPSGAAGEGTPVFQSLLPIRLAHPRQLKDLIETRPRFVGPELWLEVIRQKRRGL
jgi:hypothetical protein